MPEAAQSPVSAFGALFSRSRQPMYALDARTFRFLDANAAALRFYGRSKAQFLALTLLEIRVGPGQGQVRRDIRAHRWGLPWSGEARHRARGGRTVAVRIHSFPTRLEGRPAWISTVVPLSKARRAELAHASSRYSPELTEASSLPLLFQTNPQPMWVFDSETLRFLAVNDAARKLYGYSQKDWERLTVSDIRPKEDKRRFLTVVRRDVRRGAFHAGTWRHLRKDGSVLHIDIRAIDVTFKGRRARLSVLTDITDRTRAEESSLRTERLLHSVVNNAPIILFANDLKGDITLSEGRALSAIGRKPGESVGSNVFRGPRANPQLAAATRRALRGESFTADVPVGQRVFQTAYTPLKDERGKVTGTVGVAVDVTERRRLIEGLRESEALFRSLYDRTPAMLHSIDSAGRILNVSDLWLETLGYRREEVIGRRSVEFLTPASRKYARETILPEFYKTGVTVEAPYQMVKKNGEVIEVLLSAAAHRDASGRIDRSLAVITDVTQRKKDEAALRLANAVFESSADGISACDDAGRFVKVNRAFERLTGYSSAELLGRHFQDITSAGSRSKSTGVFKDLLRGKDSWTFEKEYRRKDGTRVPVELTVFRVDAAGGAAAGFASIAKDISERRRSQEALAEAKDWYEAIINSSRDGLNAVDRQGRLLEVNPSMERLTGYTREELLRKSFHDITPAEHRAADEAAFRRLERGEPSVVFEKEYRRKDGRRVPVVLTAFSVTDGRGGNRGYAAFVRDITEDKRAEQASHEILSLHEATLESTADGLLVVSLEGRITGYNRRFAELWRIPAEVLASGRDRRALAIAGAQLKDPKAFMGKVRDLYRRPNDESSDVLEFKDGRAYERYSRPQKIGDRVVGRVWSFRDITERRRLEKEIAETSAREQAKIGRDLHDSIGQTLTGVSLGLKALQRRAEGDQETLRAVTRLEALTRLAIQQVRDVARGLLPAELQAGDVGASLRALSAGARKMFGVPCAVVVRGDTRLRDNSTAVQLYRIAQEALNNAAKHSRSPEVRITFDAGERRLRLVVRDEGVGLPSRRAAGQGLGIAIMQHRAESLGGTLTVRRARGGGTEVVCECPRPGAPR
jgi:PAS domain S-box-containing protein